MKGSMKISTETLLAFIKADIDLQLTHQYFCGPMTTRGLCSSKCENCRTVLLESYRLDDARNPIALLTWALRNAVAIMQEQNPHEAPKKRVDWFGNQMPDINPFETLA